MTEQERQEIKARLIELGFWGADEAGDPAADRSDAMTLYNRVAERLAKGACLYSTGLTAAEIEHLIRQIQGANLDQGSKDKIERLLRVLSVTSSLLTGRFISKLPATRSVTHNQAARRKRSCWRADGIAHERVIIMTCGGSCATSDRHSRTSI